MRILFKKYSLVLASVYLVSQIIPAFTISGKWPELFYASFILTGLFFVARPVINILMLPVNLLTLNLSAWIINIAIIAFWIYIMPSIQLSAWNFPGGSWGAISISSYTFSSWQTGIIVSILIINIINFVNWIVK